MALALWLAKALVGLDCVFFAQNTDLDKGLSPEISARGDPGVEERFSHLQTLQFMGKLGIVLKKRITLNSCLASFISYYEVDYCEPVQRLALVCEEKRLFCYHGALELQIKKEKWHIMEAYLPSFQLHSSF